jgi:hypothetical protein
MLSPRAARTFLSVVLLAAPAAALRAQSIDDGVMMGRRSLCTGLLYSHDGWSQYWEGTLKRDNGNIGTLTTQSVTWMGTYGITDRLNLIGMVPYVWTNASQGVLSGMHGFQDLTVAAKFNLLETDFTKAGSLRTILVASAGTPISDYTPDFQPFSIGTASRRAAAGVTLHFQAKAGWFVTGVGSYTRRGNVKLDRSSYYTNGQLYLSTEVAMPDVIDLELRAGYVRSGLQIPITFSRRAVQGGGDIRRQDAPFVSNRANYSKLDTFVQYSLPSPRGLALRAAAAYTVSGRNVGQSTTITAGLLYTLHF